MNTYIYVYIYIHKPPYACWLDSIVKSHFVLVKSPTLFPGQTDPPLTILGAKK